MTINKGISCPLPKRDNIENILHYFRVLFYNVRNAGNLK